MKTKDLAETYSDYKLIIEIDNSSKEKINSIKRKKEQSVFLERKKRKTRLIILLPIAAILGIIIGIWIGEAVFVHTEEGMNTVCYVTDYGHCYHNANCPFLRSKHQTTVYSARQRGYRHCSFCRVGTLDITEVHEYFWGIVVGCLLTIIPILFIVIGKYFKKNKTLNAEETRDIELEERNAKKQIESLITNQGILNISGAPQDIRLESGRLSSDNNDYYRYVSLYGKCYHADSTCVNTFLEKIFFTELRKELTPCSHCAERIIIPDWYKRFIELKGIINKYSIIIPSLVVENHESYQQHRLRVEREAILYRVGTISSQMNPSSKKPPSNNK